MHDYPFVQARKQRAARRRWSGWLVLAVWWLTGSIGYVCAGAITNPGAEVPPANTILTISITRPLTLCQGSVTQIQAAVPADFTRNWYWTKNGQRYSGDREPSITLNETGTYTLGGEWENDLSVTVSGQFDLTMIDQPLTTITASTSTVCAGTSFTLSASPSPASNQYQWVDSRHRFVMTGPVLTTTGPDAYSLVVVSPSSCTYVATAPRITNFGSQTITLRAGGPTAFCEGSSVRLVQAGGDVVNPTWTRNNQPLTDPYSATLTVSESGDYAVRGDGDGCIQFPPPVSVTVGTRPSVQIVPGSLTLCEGQPTDILARTAAANALYWRRNGAEAGSARSLKASTAATFSLTVTSPAGCQQTATYAFAPQLFPSPVFKLDAPEPLWANALVQPDNVPESPDYRYQWTPAAGASDPAIARPQLSPSVSTSYTLTITDGRGCSYSDVLKLTFLTKLLAPTAFSPNGDGQNDTWAPANIDQFPDAEVYVYDRWGALVYAGRTGDAPFDGAQQGRPLPGGVYSYRVRLNVQRIEARGTLVLIR